MFLLSNILFSSCVFVFAFVKYEHDLAALHFFQDSSGDPCLGNSTSLGSGDSGAKDSDSSDASQSSVADADADASESPVADADAVHSEWCSAQNVFMQPENQFRASEQLKEHCKGIDSYFNPREYPHLFDQLIKAATNPRTIKERPGSHERLWEMLDENKRSVSNQIDIGPALLKAAFSPGFWRGVLSAVYGGTLPVTDEQLPLMDEQQNIELSDEEPERPHNHVFLYRAGNQAIYVFAGTTDFRWINPRSQSTGSMSRLWLLLMRFQPNPPWLSRGNGTYVRVSFRDTGDQTGSDDDSELDSDPGKCPVERYTDDQLDQICPGWKDFHERLEFFPPDARSPSTLWLNCDDEDDGLWRRLKGNERPGHHIRTTYGPKIEVRTSEGDDFKIESSGSLCTALEYGKFEVDVSGTLTIDGHSAEIVDWFNHEVYTLHENDFFNSAYDTPPFFCIFQKILEQIMHQSKYRQVDYRELFAKGWVSLKLGSNLRNVEGTFVLPYGPGRKGILFKCLMQETIDRDGVAMTVSSAEFGDSQSCYQQVAPADRLLHEMFGSEGISKFRRAIQTISSGASKMEEFETQFQTTNQSVIEVVQGRKNPASPKTDDVGDVRNFKQIVELLISAETCPVTVTITRAAASKLLPEARILGIAQNIQLTAKYSKGAQEFIVDLERILVEDKKRPGHHHWFRRMKPNEVRLKFIVRSGDTSSWPMEPEHKVGGVKDLLDRFLRRNDIYVGREQALLRTFTNGGDVQLTAFNYSHWERCFHLERLETLNIHVLDFLRFLILITGGSPLGCKLQRCKGQGELYWIGEIKGEEGVQDKRVKIAMTSEKFRCFGGKTEEVEQPFINLKIRVDLISDIAVPQVIFCNRCSLHKLNLNGLVSRMCRMKVNDLNRLATRAKPLNRQLRYLSFTRPYFSQSLVWVRILSCGYAEKS